MLNSLPFTPEGEALSHVFLVCTCICSPACLEYAFIASSLSLNGEHSGCIALTAGYTRKVRPELYEQLWSRACDFILVGDLIEACHVPDLDEQGIKLKHSMQAGQCKTAASVLEHPWFT